MFYVYRFLNSEYEVIYVGKTNRLKDRISTHFSTLGHLPKDCYNKTTRIDYIELPTKADMNIVELYFIGKYLPQYNIRDNESHLAIELNELKYAWIKYTYKKINGHTDDVNFQNKNEWSGIAVKNTEKVSIVQKTRAPKIQDVTGPVPEENGETEIGYELLNMKNENTEVKEILSAYNDLLKTLGAARAKADMYENKYKELLKMLEESGEFVL